VICDWRNGDSVVSTDAYGTDSYLKWNGQRSCRKYAGLTIEREPVCHGGRPGWGVRSRHLRRPIVPATAISRSTLVGVTLLPRSAIPVRGRRSGATFEECFLPARPVMAKPIGTNKLRNLNGRRIRLGGLEAPVVSADAGGHEGQAVPFSSG